MERVVKFIKENGLKFDGRGSALNGDCTIIGGFADYCGIEDYDVLEKAVKKGLGKSKLSPKVANELERVFDFAWTYDYGRWWKGEEAKKMYKF